MNIAQQLSAVLVAVLATAIGSSASAATPLPIVSGAPGIVSPYKVARSFADQKRALIDTRLTRQHALNQAYDCSLRGSRGYHRRAVIQGYRHEMSALNRQYRAEMDALRSAYRSQTALYPRGYALPACEQAWPPAGSTGNGPGEIVVPPTEIEPAPDAGNVPPVPPIPTEIYEGQYGEPQASYRRRPWMTRLAVLRNWLNALLVQLGLTA